jgi:glycosyltransferase involved in cell wall biosynthesis
MRVLLALYYYRPYISGLTIYVERLAHALARRGHTVTVLTFQYDAALPLEERSGGVRVVRVPVALRVSKGVVSPSLGRVAGALLREHDVLSVHLPNVDAPGLTLRAHRRNRPVVLTYHCDLTLPAGLFNRVVERGVAAAHHVACRLADRIVVYTEDYATHSRLLSRYGSKLVAILPPVVMPAPTPGEVAAFRAEHCAGAGPVIGFVARLAAEKGVETLVEAMRLLAARFPRAKVLFAGPYEDVLGERAYRERLRAPIAALGAGWEFLGPLRQAQLPALYGAVDVVVVPSLNSTEGFSLVQVEAMLCGTPVVVSDLPGVRQPVRMTGMGEVVAPGSVAALRDGLERVLARPERYARARGDIEALFDPDRTVTAYLELFEQEIARRGG